MIATTNACYTYQITNGEGEVDSGIVTAESAEAALLKMVAISWGVYGTLTLTDASGVEVAEIDLDWTAD